MKYTSLFEEHKKLNAKIVPFAGYQMPVTYKKIIEEYDAVRNNCGLFDVSHMGPLKITGSSSEAFLQKMTLNNIKKLDNYEAQYSAMCNLEGGLIDDLIIFKISKIEYIVIVNASNKETIVEWIQHNNNLDDINIQDMNQDYSLIALQGPNSKNYINKITNNPINIEFYKLQKIKLLDEDIILSRTGYTGELGYEILGKHNSIKKIWKYFTNNKVQPAGLAVRDVLRMEMKYCLYGNDINTKTNPLEAGLSWIIDFSKNDFIGKDKLLDIKKIGCKQKLVGFLMLGKAIPRYNYSIYLDDNKIGRVTSGTFSPSLSSGIGLAYINKGCSKIGTKILVKIRDKFVEAEIVQTPFIKNTSLHN